MKIQLLTKAIIALVFLSAMTIKHGSQEILLWPNGAPGSESHQGKEKVRITEGGDYLISNIHHPSITTFLPIPGKATGTAVIIAPGGGHSELWIDHEGYNPAKWFRDRGIA